MRLLQYALAGAAMALAATSGAAQEAAGVLYFTIGMHIEPLGTTAQGYRSSQADYRQPSLYARHAEDIRAVARIVEAHGGRMTIQAQSPFTEADAAAGSPVLGELAARGHEIGLHFHEDAHLGPGAGDSSVERWCAVMGEEIGLIRRAAPGSRVRYWSGGNLYPEIYRAAACAGLDVNSDWKNPRTQSTPLEIVGVHPWRPAGGTDGSDFALFLRHDPAGPVVFLPEGQYDTTDFASMRRSESAGSDAAYFDYLRRMLLASVEAARADRVNVFHFTVHPGEFRGDPQRPFAVLESFLSDVVDPLAAAGKLRWATFSEMADAFAAWEREHPGTEPRPVAQPPSGTPGGRRGYITFAVNAHDWTHADESARTLLRLVDLFERHNVRGDFYFTADLARALAASRPEVIERLRNSKMTISYHVRPPHPLYEGFGQRLKGLSDEELWQTLLDYETYALDPATGELDRAQPGGYRYVAGVFGRLPVVVSAPNSDARIRDTAERLFAWLGARVTVRYHEEGTRMDQPFEYANDLLVRPSDFSITRIRLPDGGQNFWWNLIHSGDGEQYLPVKLLGAKLAEWEQGEPERQPLITALIHENNFVRRGPEGWTSIYYSVVNGRRGEPLPPPWDLNAADPSVPRPLEEQEAIWSAYEDMVAWAARELNVVTSEDLVQMARAAAGGGSSSGSGTAEPFDPARLGSVERDVPYCAPEGTKLLMDVHYPKTAGGRWPALVFIHGGGWTGGDKSQTGPELAALREAGFLVASVNYRLGPQHKFPAMIEDAACAVRYLRAHASRYNVDPERIGAWGSSAGGHLAALLGTADSTAGFDTGEFPGHSSRVQAVAVFYGPTDLTVPFPGGYDSKREVFAPFDPALASPVTYVSPDDPPFLFVHGDRDTLVPLSQSEILLKKLQEAGVPASLIVVANAQHALVPAAGQPISPTRQEITQMVVEFFRKYLAAE